MGLQTTGTGLSGQSGENIQADFVSLSSRALAYLATVIGVSAPLKLTGTDPNSVPFTIEGAAAQVENLFEVTDSASKLNFAIGPNPLAAPALSLIDSTIGGADTKGIDMWTGSGSTGNAYLLRFRNGFQTVWHNIESGKYRVVANDGGLELSTMGSSGTREVEIRAGNSVPAAKFDASIIAGHTRFFLYDVDNGQLERVTVGAADSGGAGFKVLRIPN